MIRLHPLGLLSYNTIIHVSLIGGCNAGRCHDRCFNTGKNFFGNSGLSSRRHHRDNVRDMFGPFNKNSVPLWFRLQIIFLIRWHYIVLYNGRCWWNWHVWILRFSPDVKKCEKCENEKMRKNVKKTFENPVGKVELWFLFLQVWFFGVPVLLQLLCCLPNFCRLKIGEEQFKSIGSGLCRSQIC